MRTRVQNVRKPRTRQAPVERHDSLSEWDPIGAATVRKPSGKSSACAVGFTTERVLDRRNRGRGAGHQTNVWSVAK